MNINISREQENVICGQRRIQCLDQSVDNKYRTLCVISSLTDFQSLRKKGNVPESYTYPECSYTNLTREQKEPFYEVDIVILKMLILIFFPTCDAKSLVFFCK